MSKNGKPVGNVKLGRRFHQVERDCVELWPDSVETLVAAAPTPKTLQEVYEELFGDSIPQ